MRTDSNLALVVGLGNPGNKYVGTRHNIGFALVESFFDEVSKERSQKTCVIKEWREKDSYIWAEVILDSIKIFLLKPQTFMNCSGQAVQAFSAFHKIDLEKILVIHDELDLPLGTIRLKKGGGDGGHNGLKSISTHMPSSNYIRLRVGIGRPNFHENQVATEESVSNWVLGKFLNSELESLKVVQENVLSCIKELNMNGLSKAQNKFNH
jgi:peptidyl-tRNA hydrolase, PTH1 family